MSPELVGVYACRYFDRKFSRWAVGMIVITTWVDAYYFTVITLTTIGYGDVGPTTPFTRIFTTFYVFVGLGIIAGLIGIVGEAVVEDATQRVEKKNA